MIETQIYHHLGAFKTESGDQLSELEIAFTSFGKLNSTRSNVVWICHAFTADSHPEDWWPGMVGENKFFSPDKYFIVCANILGSNYGSTSPLSVNPLMGKPYYRDFPLLTVRDLVAAHLLLAKYLKIETIHLLIGGSIGGYQAIEWAIMKPNMIEHLIMIASGAKTSPWRRAHNSTQRMIIEADKTYFEDIPMGGLNGMKAARSMALLSYRNEKTYRLTQSESDDNMLYNFKVDSYQRYQGEKLAKRFNAYSYYTLLKMLDTHDIGRKRGGAINALKQIRAKTLILGIESDLLFFIEDQMFMYQFMPNAKLVMIQSDYGHDGFLLENEKISNELSAFVERD